MIINANLCLRNKKEDCAHVYKQNLKCSFATILTDELQIRWNTMPKGFPSFYGGKVEFGHLVFNDSCPT